MVDWIIKFTLTGGNSADLTGTNMKSTDRLTSIIISIVFFHIIFSTQELGAQSSISDQLQNLHVQKFEWLVKFDQEKLENILHDSIIYIHSNGWEETKSEVLNNIVSGKLKYEKVEVLDSKARIQGSTGIVTGKGIFHVTLEGKPLTIQLSYTEVYILEVDAWKLISRHSCKL